MLGDDWCFVTVEDAAYAVLALDILEDGLSVRLSDRTSEPLAPATLALDADGVVTARVKAGRAKATIPFCSTGTSTSSRR